MNDDVGIFFVKFKFFVYIYILGREVKQHNQKQSLTIKCHLKQHSISLSFLTDKNQAHLWWLSHLSRSYAPRSFSVYIHEKSKHFEEYELINKRSIFMLLICYTGTITNHWEHLFLNNLHCYYLFFLTINSLQIRSIKYSCQ